VFSGGDLKVGGVVSVERSLPVVLERPVVDGAFGHVVVDGDLFDGGVRVFFVFGADGVFGVSVDLVVHGLSLFGWVVRVFVLVVV